MKKGFFFNRSLNLLGIVDINDLICTEHNKVSHQIIQQVNCKVKIVSCFDVFSQSFCVGGCRVRDPRAQGYKSAIWSGREVPGDIR